jgi:hypothetical protein
MTARLLLSGFIAAPIVRRNRRDDGSPFGVATVRDTDRGEPRSWVVFVNDVGLIEKFESFKDGEPIAVAGPFTVTYDGSRLVHRITADAIVSARKQRKKRGSSAENLDVDPNDAPKNDDNDGRPFDDTLPF